MICFSAKNHSELNDFLENKYIHDGCFQNAIFSYTDKTFVVNIVNNIWNDSVCMSFVDIYQFVSVADYKWSDDETINAFAVLDSNEKMPEAFGKNIRKDKLYFVFEMFSGNIIYIACSELHIGALGTVCKTGDGSLS